MKRFLGVWKLINAERHVEGRVELPYGRNPVGRLTYDNAGRMSAQIMRTGSEEIGEAVARYVGYYGTFEVDESAAIVIHHVEATSEPSWVGTDQKRAFRFHDGRLILTAALAEGVYELTWEREPD